jgi:hypothetical protein
MMMLLLMMIIDIYYLYLLLWGESGLILETIGADGGGAPADEKPDPEVLVSPYQLRVGGGLAGVVSLMH